MMITQAIKNLILIATLLIPATAALAIKHTAANLSQLNAAIAASNPGDSIVMINGIWSNADINFNAKGTSHMPVVLLAETPGSVILNGTSSLTFSAPYLI